MEKRLSDYWQQLNNKYSSNQVFFILIYFTLTVYQQTVKGKERVSFGEYRLALRDMLGETMDYDIKESAVRLSERIEWTLLDSDEEAKTLLYHLGGELKSYFKSEPYFCENKSRKEVKDIEKLNEVIEIITRMAEINELYTATPKSITVILQRIFEQRHADSMADFCCGSGGLGIAVWKQLEAASRVSYWGMDFEPVMCDISRIMAYFNKITHGVIREDNILTYNEKEKTDRYDLILLDVPRGRNRNIQLEEYRGFLKNIRQRSIFSDWLYVLSALNSLSDRGTAAAVVTAGTLIRKNEIGLRKELIEQDMIEAVITLPVNLYSNERTGSEIIIFNKRKEQKRKKHILFIDISNYYSRINRNYYTISQEGVDLVSEIFHNYVERKNISTIIDTSLIEKETFSLKPLYYLGLQNTRNSVQNKLCLKDVAQIIRGVQLKKEEEEALSENGAAYFLNIKDIQEGRIQYEGARLISPKSQDWYGKFLIHEDDILITSKGVAFKTAIVEENPPEAFICGNITLIRVNQEKYHPYVLLEYLRSKQGMFALESIQSGTTIRVLNNANLERLPIPAYDKQLARQAGSGLKENQKKYYEKMMRLKETYEAERTNLLELMEKDEKRRYGDGKNIYQL